MPIFTRRVRALAATLTAMAALAVPTPAQAATPVAPTEFVALSDVAPSILQDIRYATKHNFVGRRIDGYLEPSAS